MLIYSHNIVDKETNAETDTVFISLNRTFRISFKIYLHFAQTFFIEKNEQVFHINPPQYSVPQPLRFHYMHPPDNSTFVRV